MGVAGLVGLKKRIKSVESTRKLTKAMSLVATSKLKKVRRVLAINNDYCQAYREIMAEVTPSLPEDNKYVQKNSTNKKLIIVIASDMGMCGSYNNAIVTKLEEITKDNMSDYSLLVLGEKGKSLCKRHGYETIEYDKRISDIPELEEVSNVFEYGFSKYSEGLFSEVIIVYTWFKNTIVREVEVQQLLPLKFDTFENEKVVEGEFDVEGDGESLMEVLIPSYCKCVLFNSVLNSKASEHSVRTETMNSATKNADELISALKLKYNRIRQGAITQEITEIVGGVDAQG